MPKHLLATTAILFALGSPVFAEEPAADTANQTKTHTTTADSNAQGAVQPDPDGATGTTPGGGVTPTAKEIIPDTPEDEAAVDPQDLDSTGATEMDSASRPGATGSSVVSEEIVRELRQMALEAEKKSAKPPETKSDEALEAERQAIERHRAALFARVDERS